MDQRYATTSEPATTPESTRRRPLRRDAERNRLRILSAARTVFAERGLEASLDEVAHEAGLGVGTVYRRFPNRDALVEALLADVLDSITLVVEQSLAMPSAWDGLRHFMAAIMELQCRDKGLRDVMLSYRSGDPSEELTRNVIKPAVADLVLRAQQEGELRADLSVTDVGVLELAALGAAELTTAARPDAGSRYLAIIMDGMRARPDAGPHGNSVLQQEPIGEDELDACMADWKYGGRERPRHR